MEELEGQRNICRTTLRRAVEAENQVKDMKEKSSGLEGELLSFDVERDQLREDRRKVKNYLNFFRPNREQLGQVKLYSRGLQLGDLSTILSPYKCFSI